MPLTSRLGDGEIKKLTSAPSRRIEISGKPSSTGFEVKPNRYVADPVGDR
jgi:hypothetical protein